MSTERADGLGQGFGQQPSEKRACNSCRLTWSIVISLVILFLLYSFCFGCMDPDSRRIDSIALPTDSWSVAIFVDYGYGPRLICGGVLVNANVVLTSASCFELSNKDQLQIMDGEENSAKVKEILIHPDFTPGSYYNDVALVKLDQPFNISSRVHLLSEATLGRYNVASPKLVSEGWVSEWEVKTRPLNLNSNLKQGESENKVRKPEPKRPILKPRLQNSLSVPLDECETAYKEFFSHLEVSFEEVMPRGIDETLLCIYNPGFKKQGHQLLITGQSTIFHSISNLDFGIRGTRAQALQFPSVLCDFNSCPPNLPSIYTNLVSHYDWITSTLNEMETMKNL